MAVIELDTSAPWSLDRPARDRRPPLLIGLLIAVAVLIALTGPTVVAGRPLSLAWQQPAFDGFFWLTPTTVFTINETATARLTLTARELRRGTPMWSVALAGPLAAGYPSGWDSLVSRFPPTRDLGVTTLVLDTRTGQVVGAYPAAAIALVYIADDVAVTIDRDPPAGPQARRPDLSAPETGLGQAYLVTARDVRSGAVRWRRVLPAGTGWSLPGVRTGTEGVVGLPPGQHWLVTSTPAGAVEVWDLSSGRTVAHRDVGRLGQEGYVSALADTVLVRRQAADEPGAAAPDATRGLATLSSYDGTTLVGRWVVPAPALYATPLQCGARLCLATDRGVVALEVPTGAVAWRLSGRHLRQAGPAARALVTLFGEQLELVDPVTGDNLPADARWRIWDAAPYGDLVVIAQSGPGAGTTLGLLDVSMQTIRTLGAVSPLSLADQCLAAPSAGGVAVACQAGEAVRVWIAR